MWLPEANLFPNAIYTMLKEFDMNRKGAIGLNYYATTNQDQDNCL